MAPDVIYAARNILKEYHLNRVTISVLKGLDIEIHRGEIISIVGISGVSHFRKDFHGRAEKIRLLVSGAVRVLYCGIFGSFRQLRLRFIDLVSPIDLMCFCIPNCIKPIKHYRSMVINVRVSDFLDHRGIFTSS